MATLKYEDTTLWASALQLGESLRSCPRTVYLNLNSEPPIIPGVLLEDFGQKVDLTRRFREVLLNYPKGTTIGSERFCRRLSPPTLWRHHYYFNQQNYDQSAYCL
ncbi:Uncharacterized protein Fot_30055 [Forsythia ovata]|uniref:Uncharacterized protein n=1 Tax=Forsythia ovata TaxID=205694 RepID=A0ABD1TTM8_9LAMI